jgi:hypothetical protein
MIAPSSLQIWQLVHSNKAPKLKKQNAKAQLWRAPTQKQKTPKLSFGVKGSNPERAVCLLM